MVVSTPDGDHDNKFFSRLMSKESSMANSSCRVYYGEAAGAVPFMWESQPGTPKHTLSHTSLPPLTPPPSYSYNPKNPKSMPSKKSSKAKLLLGSIIPTTLLTLRKAHMSQSSSSSLSSISSSSSSSYSSCSSSSHSSASSSLKNKKGTRTSTHDHHQKHTCFSVSRKKQPFDYYDEDDDNDDDADPTSGSPISTLCFGVEHKTSTNFNGIGGGCFSVRNMKFAFLSITRVAGRRAY